MTTPFYIKPGIRPQQYNERNNLRERKAIDRQPAGLNFYEKDWSAKSPGQVYVDNGRFSFNIDNVLGTTGSENTSFPEMGISEFSILSGISADEFINHNQARILFMDMLQGLLKLGWQPYIESHGHPRLMGQQSIKYAIEESGDAADPHYFPTLEEWMALGSSQNWVVHANGVFLNIYFRRNINFMEKDGEGVYLLAFDIMTKEQHAKNYFSGSDRARWQSLWVDEIKNIKLIRYQTEVALIKKGYHINTDYIEPIIHPADPVEPDNNEAKALLNYIEQHNN